MTQDQKRIKIAEARGWTPHDEKEVHAAARLFNPGKWWRLPSEDTIATLELLPDCFNDLNACHEMEEVLTNDQYDVFWNILAALANRQHAARQLANRAFLSATAAQRCEAFGRTLNLWEAGE